MKSKRPRSNNLKAKKYDKIILKNKKRERIEDPKDTSF